MMGAMLFFFFFFFAAMTQTAPKGDGPPPEFFLPFGAAFLFFIFFVTLLFTLPAFIAGYALLKRKPWARTASIVAAVLEAMNMPIGTAVCIYSFWFMFSDEGKRFYEQVATEGTPRPALYEATPRPWWHDAPPKEREPVRQREDWRGE
jgi:hypothetical protein